MARAIWSLFLSAALFSTVAHGATRWALLIGVDKCEAIGKLDVCTADARALKAVLVQVGYADDHVVLLTDDTDDLGSWPTIGNMRRRIEMLSQVGERGDTILIFFSGHGVMRDDDAHLVPVDGDERNTIALSWVTRQLAASQATNKVLIVDACHSGGAKGVDGIAPSLANDTEVVMLLSCDKNQKSWPDEARGLSVFTVCLVDGLGGKASGVGGNVTQNALFEYVRGAVKARTYSAFNKLQIPVMGGASQREVVLATCPPGGISVPTVATARPAPMVAPMRRNAPPIYTDWPFSEAEAKRRQKEWADYLGVPLEKDFDLPGGAKMTMVLIPPGDFLMGGDESAADVVRKCVGLEAKAEWFANEHPQHRVNISKPFWLGEYEVTQEQWEGVMEKNPSYFKGAKKPVEQVSWDDCQDFCRKTGLRLPTEAEWEYACRAGTGTPFYFGETISTDQANYDGNYAYGSGRKGTLRKETVSVGTFPANAWGLHDMHGNVFESCADLYAEYPGGEVNAQAETWWRESHMWRGGCWGNNPGDIRSAARGWGIPSRRDARSGFRVARTLE